MGNGDSPCLVVKRVRLSSGSLAMRRAMWGEWRVNSPRGHLCLKHADVKKTYPTLDVHERPRYGSIGTSSALPDSKQSLRMMHYITLPIRKSLLVLSGVGCGKIVSETGELLNGHYWPMTMLKSISSGRGHIVGSQRRSDIPLFGLTSVLFRSIVTVCRCGFFGTLKSVRNTFWRIYEDGAKEATYFKWYGDALWTTSLDQLCLLMKK